MNQVDWYEKVADVFASGADTLLGAILGSIFTIIGVVLTNRVNQKNIRLQLEHDRNQKKREYELGTRREVYLQAAEAISAALATVSSFSRLDIEYRDLMREYDSHRAYIARVHVVATEETALRVANLMREIVAAFLELNIERSELMMIRSKMRTKIDEMNRHNAARDAYLEQMRVQNTEGTLDSGRIAVLQRGFEFEQGRASAAAEAHNELLRQLSPRHISFTEHCMREHQRLQGFLPPLISSVRFELEMPIDLDKYSKVLNSAAPFSRDQIERLFSAAGAKP